MLFKFTGRILRLIWGHRKILWMTIFIDLKKKYAGSLLGDVWIFLYPLLFLSVYLFVYLVLFDLRYPGLDTLGSVIYIFSGLVPYLAFMESMNGAVVSVKQNIHLVRNIILPIELIPLRIVLMVCLVQLVGLGMILLLTLFNHSWSWHLLALPLAWFIQILFLSGIALWVAPMGVILVDISYFINLLTILLLFISPIGFMSSMLPSKLHLIVNLNPITYLLQPFRFVFLPSEWSWITWGISLFLALSIFISGCNIFSRFKNKLLD